MSFTKYKQGVEKNFDVIAIAANPQTAWFNQPVNPSLPQSKRKTMGQVGCALTSAATIAGIFGKETTPLEMRDLFLGLPCGPAIDSGNNTYLSRLRLEVGDKTLMKGPSGGNFDSIATELRAGRPLLLCVPIKGSTGVGFHNTAASGEPPSLVALTLPNGNLQANRRRHYILAYGLNPALGPTDPVTPSDIFISDPAYTAAYRSNYIANYSAGEELVDVTLQDYFNIINKSPIYSFDPLSWFNDFTFVRRSDSRKVQVRKDDRSSNDRARQVQRFEVIENAPPPNPCVMVESPVELRLTIGGVTYASSPEIAQSGDVIATRIDPDIVAEFDFENETGLGEDEPVDPHPSYLLELPPVAAGLAAAVEIHGIGDGGYVISLGTGAEGLVATNQLRGVITNGQVVTGSIDVGPPSAPAPPVMNIEPVGDTHFLLRLPARVGATYQLHFSKDLDEWSPEGSPQVAVTGIVEWLIERPTVGPAFYRASYDPGS